MVRVLANYKCKYMILGRNTFIDFYQIFKLLRLIFKSFFPRTHFYMFSRIFKYLSPESRQLPHKIWLQA